ncbi:uncharacterized protein BT62DRAFT_623407 [Guyanagaster necrorhizus]|uniref:Uncharacterized protein n=1 Tax=Guyanagaster necrorhizus TaxID=856835 RepID=A0A9P7W005_9AGAR|nr:uncharacterized protein BT62DRAFT_623407 [Guyanagaster necrorhizus MCA 3950]KAG7450092.1 hypothetical protein BT62DRAFT_623407 [Guyanagaster necrorhizus MCA 3950]
MPVRPLPTPDGENAPLLESSEPPSSSPEESRLGDIRAAESAMATIREQERRQIELDEMFLLILFTLLLMGIVVCSAATVNIVGHAILQAFQSHFLADVPLLWSFKIGLVGNAVLIVGTGLLFLLVQLCCPVLLVLFPDRLLTLAFSTTAAVIGTAILGPTELLRGAAVAGAIGETIALAFANALSVLFGPPLGLPFWT